MMDNADENGIEILKSVYDELKPGGAKMQKNFETLMDKEDYWSALGKIEDNISKGRFAQRIVDGLIPELVPDYINEGIKTIVQKVKDSYE